MIRLLAALAFVLVAAGSAVAQGPATVWPAGAVYDASIPEPKAVIGHDLGKRLTRAGDVHRYFEALAKAAPDRMRLGDYGKTWEGRALPYAIVTSPRNLARIEEIKANARALADPRRTSAAQAAAIIQDQPAIVWLAYSVHGNETSPAEASMATARHLLASNDPAVAAWLEQTVVIMIPTQNPDGRDRFINGYEAGLGLEPDTDGLSVERSEVWPSGRFNHYLFDLNRDWFAQTQPETRGHSALMRQWYPQVVADAHEMGTDSTFFFPPEAEPLNPLLPEAQVRSRAIFGRNHAAVFDREGIDYFTRETFDAFYPGYGDNWPSYFGAVSMTYEQASVRGVVARRSSGEVLTLTEATRNHFLISLSTIQTSADNRERLLRDFWDYHVKAYADGRARGAWILPRAAADPGAADRLAGLLARQGVEISQAEAAFRACGQSYEAGTYIIDAGQPQGRLVQVLFDPKVEMRPDFVAEQERRRAKGLPPEMYDLTAWALPPLFNTPAERCKGVSAGRPLTAEEIGRGRVSGEGAAYIVPPGSQAMALLTGGLRQGLKIRSPEKAFTVGGRRFPAGSLVVPAAGNPADLRARLERLTADTGAHAIAVADTWVTEGPSFGSGYAPAFPTPRIAMAWDQPASPTAAGATRYLIEREFGYPVTAIRTGALGGADLSRYQVLILPDGGNYRGVLGAGGVAALRDWVRRGGVLIALGDASALLADPGSEMLASRIETLAAKEGEEPPKAPDPKEANAPGSLINDEGAYQALLRPIDGAPDASPGVVAKALVDGDHWLGAGAAPSINTLMLGSSIYTPLRLNEGANVVRYAAANDLLVAGYLWKETRAQLAYKPLVMVQEYGRGQLIAFTQDPTARGFQRGMDVLFLNAIFRGAAHASPIR